MRPAYLQKHDMDHCAGWGLCNSTQSRGALQHAVPDPMTAGRLRDVLYGTRAVQVNPIDAVPSEFFEAFGLDISEQELQSRIRSPKVRLVFRYWRDRRNGNGFPRRSDIDPAAIREALPHLTVTQISYAPFRVLYRLVGTEVARWSKQDFTHRYADELVFQDDDRDWTDYYRQVVDQKSVCFGVTYWRETHARPYWIEHMICPLSSDGVTIDQCLAVEDYEKMSWREFDALPPVVPRHGQR